MIDFHIHIGPGGLLPSEALRYACRAGCRAVGLVLRSDGGPELDGLAALAAQVRKLGLFCNVEALTGVELVQVPPALLPETVARARSAGAELVLVHGETLAEEVDTGTNLAAMDAGADILAHPGLIDERAAAYAAEKGVALELTACPRHGLSNAHVAVMAQRFGCALVFGGNARAAHEFVSRPQRDAVLRGAGLTAEGIAAVDAHCRELARRLLSAKKAT